MRSTFLSILFLLAGVQYSLAGKGEFLNDSLPVFKSIEAALESPLDVRQLVLRKDKLDVFPLEILQFKNLEYLDLSKNKLDSIPPQISELKKLKVLILSSNDLAQIQNEIFLLSELRVLVVSNNDIGYISPSIKKLKMLEHLDLWSTNVFIIPEEMSSLEHLVFLDLRGISLNVNQQSAIEQVLPNVKIYFSPPCNCNF